MFATGNDKLELSNYQIHKARFELHSEKPVLVGFADYSSEARPAPDLAPLTTNKAFCGQLFKHARLGNLRLSVAHMRTPTDAKSKKKRKPSSEWNRRTNTVPLTERGAFQLPEAANYLSRSITVVRRLIKKGDPPPSSVSRHRYHARRVRSVASGTNRHREACGVTDETVEALSVAAATQKKASPRSKALN